MGKAANAYYTVMQTSSRQQRLLAQIGLSSILQSLGYDYSAAYYLFSAARISIRQSSSLYSLALERIGTLPSKVVLEAFNLNEVLVRELSKVPRSSRGFYFYYKGLSQFRLRRYQSARKNLKKVPQNSRFAMKALFHLGVLTNIAGDLDASLAYFSKVKQSIRSDEDYDWLYDQANLNIARTYYALGQYKKSIVYYAKVPRLSESWLQALFESSWAFYKIDQINNCLGNLHTIQSPFFEHRFHPESYILKAVAFLKLCRYDEVKSAMERFELQYQTAEKQLKKVLALTARNPSDFFRLVDDFKSGDLKKFKKIHVVFDDLSEKDAYTSAIKVQQNIFDELESLKSAPYIWRDSGLYSNLKKNLKKIRSTMIKKSGNDLYDLAVGQYRYLVELSNQKKLITAELLLGKVDVLRKKLNIKTSSKKRQFIGGLMPLKIGQSLEYWPFEGEYWSDELGGYVYNIASSCDR